MKVAATAGAAGAVIPRWAVESGAAVGSAHPARAAGTHGRCGRSPRPARGALLLLWLAGCGPPLEPGPVPQAGEPPPAAALGVEAEGTATRRAARVPLQATPAAQLEAARAAEARLRQLEPRARLEARLELVEAWRAAAAHPEASAGERALALIGAGQSLSALGFHLEAQAAFEHAAESCAEPLETAEAWLEAGHNARRAGDLEAALGRYERAALAARGQGSAHSIAAAAGLWAARVELARGALDSAVQRFEALAESPIDPLLRLAAFDELALLALSQADPEGAAGWIQRARLSLASAAAADTDTGRRLRRALAHLRALPELTLAIEERARGAAHAPTWSGADSQLRFLIDSED
jgi:hypothetical protein